MGDGLVEVDEGLDRVADGSNERSVDNQLSLLIDLCPEGLSRRSEVLGSVGVGVAVAGGADGRCGPVVVELLLELVDALDAPLVGPVEGHAGGLLSSDEFE
jgi:hypothetical protein